MIHDFQILRDTACLGTSALQLPPPLLRLEHLLHPSNIRGSVAIREAHHHFAACPAPSFDAVDMLLLVKES